MSAQDAAMALPRVRAAYDPDADALYLQLREGEQGFVQGLAEGIAGHFDPRGRLLGLEVRGVRRLPPPHVGEGARR